MHHLASLRCHSLSNLTFMMREYQVHASSVYVEMLAQVFPAHSRTFTVPSGESLAPGRGPSHDVLGLSFLPEREIGLIVLLSHPVERAALVHHVLKIASRELSVVIFLVVSLYVKVYGAVALVGKTVVDDFLNQLYLFHDMSRGVRLYAWRKHVEGLHRRVITVGIILRYLHRLKLFEPCFLRNFVLALVCIVFQVAHIGDIPHVAHLVSEVLQVTEKDVEGYRRTRMAEMRVAIDGRSAHIHSHVWCVKRLKAFFLTRQRIINKQCLFHIFLLC